ncbi:PREDICTED: E3 ubiquitin-protein ligase RNF19A-like [Priapulus caudatus]|uniref:RBR-type E3 ubiquitin transferase n=1 Tax=Priapulus caudatus TaxID=37621 RepID=A0ABM1F9Q8_PRICU|nr:PREDICTED: E3 ubiquitin-protein ligase RNF19A-like [Priapulus caudatus]
MGGGREVDTYSNCSSALSVNSESKKRGLSRFSLRQILRRPSDRKSRRAAAAARGANPSGAGTPSSPSTRNSTPRLPGGAPSRRADETPAGEPVVVAAAAVAVGDGGEDSTLECPLCLSEQRRGDFAALSTCDHRACAACLRRYLTIEITESRVNVACPSCAERLHPTDIRRALADDAIMCKYEEFALRRYLATEPDARWCPAPDCGLILSPCPQCQAYIMKMDDGSCNHMTCAVCGSEFCWLCMKEISDLHYLSPSGCTFWGKKPWSRKKKILWQLGTLVGAPVGIALIAGVSVPAIIIGMPVWVGRKLNNKYRQAPKHKRNLYVVGGVTASVIVSPVLAGLAVGIGVPILLAYVYGVVPISLCRSGGCGVSTSSSGGVRMKFDDDNDTLAGGVSTATDARSMSNHNVANPSIGEVSMMTVSSGQMDRVGVGAVTLLRGVRGGEDGEDDHDSASNVAIAGESLTGSLCGSTCTAPGPSGYHNRLDVHSEFQPNKRFSLSSESATASLSERCSTTTVSLGDNASTCALAGSIASQSLRPDKADSVSKYCMVMEVHADVEKHERAASARRNQESPQSIRSSRSVSSRRSYEVRGGRKSGAAGAAKRRSVSIEDRLCERASAVDVATTMRRAALKYSHSSVEGAARRDFGACDVVAGATRMQQWDRGEAEAAVTSRDAGGKKLVKSRKVHDQQEMCGSSSKLTISVTRLV